MNSSPLHCNRHRSDGFTLIELLVTISIIAVLAALLVPQVGNLLNGARASETIANLRSLQTANTGYAADHDGFFVANWPESPAAYQHGWWQYAPFLEYLGGDAPEGTSNLGWDAWPEAAKTGRNVNPLINTGGDKKDRYGTIAMNMSRFSHWTSGDPMLSFNNAHHRLGMLKQSLIAYPNEFIMFAEGAGYYVDYYRRLDWSRLADDKKDKQESNGLAFRNGGDVAYAVVASGAVKPLRPADISASTPAVQRMFYFNGSQ